MRNPNDIHTVKELKYWDEHAQRDEAELLEAIEKIKEYRMMIYRRVNLIETAPYKMRLTCIREKRYSGKVYYYVTLSKIVEGVGETEKQRDIYTGKERHIAIKRYKELFKQHPGIETEFDIEHGKWER